MMPRPPNLSGKAARRVNGERKHWFGWVAEFARSVSLPLRGRVPAGAVCLGDTPLAQLSPRNGSPRLAQASPSLAQHGLGDIAQARPDSYSLASWASLGRGRVGHHQRPFRA